MEIDYSIQKKQAFRSGSLAIYSLASDQRFSYSCYFPSYFSPANRPEILVVIHDNSRNFSDLLSGFSSYSEKNNMIIIAPIFPIGIGNDGFGVGFNYLAFDGIKYDEVLLDIIDEVSSLSGSLIVDFSIFGLFGGGQFVHRFLYFHGRRVKSAVIASPEYISFLDNNTAKGLEATTIEYEVGKEIDFEGIKVPKILLLAGEYDDYEIPAPKNYAEKRCEEPQRKLVKKSILMKLCADFRADGISAEVIEVKHAFHDSGKMIASAIDFFKVTDNN